MDQTLQNLHAEIDADYDARLRKLAEERDKEHQALDRVWPRIAQMKLPGVQAASTAPVDETSGSNGDGKPFPMLPRIQAFFEANSGRELTQQTIFSAFTKWYPELRAREAGHLKGQISSTLAKLLDRGEIELVRKGTGGNPHIYKHAGEAKE